MPSGRTSYAFLACIAALAAAPAAASAATGSNAGGVMFVETPAIAKVACVKRCGSHKRVQGGSTVRISGRSLAKVSSAVFYGTAGSGDDLRVKVTPKSAVKLSARVPRNAVSGPISLVTTDAVESKPSAPVAILPPLPSGVLSSKSHVFPVRGPHDYGGANADFGSGRAGHSHQGHDVFARCGTPLVAARGGRVQVSSYHSAAGNYVVIDGDGDGTGVDYVYMHLAERSPFRKGDRVVTGQRIGSVGDTGNASGCHLHFELWSAPGYYEGGRPLDPLRALKAWDRAS